MIDGPFKHSPENLQEKGKPEDISFSKDDNYIKFRNFTYVSKSLLDAKSKGFKDDDNN